MSVTPPEELRELLQASMPYGSQEWRVQKDQQHWIVCPSRQVTGPFPADELGLADARFVVAAVNSLSAYLDLAEALGGYTRVDQFQHSWECDPAPSGVCRCGLDRLLAAMARVEGK